MKRLILKAACAAGILAGCAPLPQTADEFRSSNHVLLEKKSVTIARSASRVNAAIQQGAKRCLTTQQRQHFHRATPYGGQTTTITADYSAAFKRSSGGRGELSIYRITSGAITPGSDNGGFMSYVVDVIPSGSKTRLDIYSGKIAYGDLNAAVMQWAKGGALRCPTMP